MTYLDVKGPAAHLDAKSLSIKSFLNVIINAFILDDCLYIVHPEHIEETEERT